MIRIKLLTGPYAQNKRVVPSSMDPVDLLREISQRGWEWEVDYTAATPDEYYSWARQDMGLRIVLTLQAGKKVRFQEKEYFGTDIETVGAIEDAVASSNRMVSWKYHEWGLEITVHGWTQ